MKKQGRKATIKKTRTAGKGSREKERESGAGLVRTKANLGQ